MLKDSRIELHINLFDEDLFDEHMAHIEDNFAPDHITDKEFYIQDQITQNISMLQKKIKVLTHYSLMLEACRDLENRDISNFFENLYSDFIACLYID